MLVITFGELLLLDDWVNKWGFKTFRNRRNLNEGEEGKK